MAVQIESLDETKTNKGEDIVDLGVVIICEKASHKGMLIGKQGAMLKKIGSIARVDLEEYFEIMGKSKGRLAQQRGFYS